MKGFQDLAGIPGMGDEAMSAAAQVKAAMANASASRSKRSGEFAFDRVSPREKILAPLLGIYLGIAVGRLHERFPVLAVPMLMWTLMAIMLITLAVAVPAEGWRKVWHTSIQLRLVGVLTALAVITVPLGIWMSGSFSYLIDRFTVAIAVYVACIILLRDRKVLRRVVSAYVLIVTIVAARNLSSYFNHELDTTMMTDEEKIEYQHTGVANPEFLRQSFGGLDPNDIAAVMATTFPLALWLATGSVLRRIFWTPCALALAIAVIPTASRGGLLGLMGGAVVLALLGAKGIKRGIMVVVLCVGAAAFMSVAGSGMDRMENLDGNDYNFTTSEGRIAIWKRGIVWTIKRPWGYGLDNFPTYFGMLNGPNRAAHNSLIQYAVELGVLGIAAYLMICGTLVRSLFRMRQLAAQAGRAGAETITLTGHVLAMLVACWVTGFFLSNAYYPMTYMAIGIASAVVLSSHAPTEPVATPVAPISNPFSPRRRQFQAFNSR